jgi:hypothetical protein
LCRAAATPENAIKVFRTISTQSDMAGTAVAATPGGAAVTTTDSFTALQALAVGASSKLCGFQVV